MCFELLPLELNRIAVYSYRLLAALKLQGSGSFLGQLFVELGLLPFKGVAP